MPKALISKGDGGLNEMHISYTVNNNDTYLQEDWLVDYLKRLEAPGKRPTATTQTEPYIRATELSRQRNKENIIYSSPKPSPKDSVPISTEKKRGRGRPAKVCAISRWFI